MESDAKILRLQIMVNALFVGGALGLLAALYFAIRGKPYRPGRHPIRVLLASLVALAIATLAYCLTVGLTVPRESTVVSSQQPTKKF